MGIRQKKKRFKKQFGFNPPCHLTINISIKVMKNQETVIAIVERLKRAITKLWENMKDLLIKLAEDLRAAAVALVNEDERKGRQHTVLADFQRKALLQQKQQESEVKTIESNFNIYGYGGRKECR